MTKMKLTETRFQFFNRLNQWALIPPGVTLSRKTKESTVVTTDDNSDDFEINLLSDGTNSTQSKEKPMD